MTDTRLAARSLERAAFASFLAAAKRGHGDASATAATLYPQDTVARRILTRGAVAPLTTGYADLTGAMTATATGDFLASLAPQSAGARLIASGLRLTLAPEQQLALPVRPAGAVPLAWVPEADAIPIRRHALAKVLLGPSRKMAAISVHSRELARQANADAIFGALLREDAAASLDAALFATTPATEDAPAGLLHGVAPLTPTTGSGLEAMELDLIALSSAVSAAGGSDVMFVASPAQAAAVQIRKPEIAARVVASSFLAAGTVVAVDRAALVSGFGAAPDVESSHYTTLHLDDAPAQISMAGSPNIVAAATQSTFQHALIATRLILDAAFVLRAPGLIAHIEGVTW